MVYKVHSGFSFPIRQRQNNRFGNSSRKYEKSSKPSLKPIIIENSTEFFRQTTFHGLKFVGDSQLHIIERLFFGISFLIALAVCTNFIINVYKNWELTPVLISKSPSLTTLDRIPFPAVTICNMNQAMASKVKDLRNDSVEYSIVQTFCNRKLQLNSTQDLHKTNDWRTYKRFLFNISQSCRKMLLECRFGSIKQNCSDIFKPIITDEGVCCTFNTVHTKFMYREANLSQVSDYATPPEVVPVKWTPSTGYQEPKPKRFYPRTVPATGISMGLTVILNVDIKEYYCSSTNGAGFRASIHNPIETPYVKETGIFIQTGHETIVRISPIIMESDEIIRSISPKERQCLFEDERNLTFFSVYSRRNCENECEAQLLIDECSCIAFHMPRIDPNVTICGINEAECVKKAKIKSQIQTEAYQDCNDNCTPSCSEISYLSDVFTTSAEHDENFTIQEELLSNMTTAFIHKNIGIAHIFFRENAFRSEIKQRFIGLTEFLSNTGGLMGLFLGFSFISVVEIIYYLTIRPYFAYKRMKQNETDVPITSLKEKTLKVNPFSTYYKYRSNEFMRPRRF